MRHQGGSAGEILGRKLARSDPRSLVGRECQGGNRPPHRAHHLSWQRAIVRCVQDCGAGLDRARIILGCLRPGQTSSVYADALSRLSDRLRYLNASGDKSQDATRFWFDTRANLRREMEDRKRRFDDKTEVRGKIADVLKKTAFKLCRMLLPGGETKQIEPYHPTAKAV